MDLKEIVRLAEEEGESLRPELERIISKTTFEDGELEYNFDKKPELLKWLREDKYQLYLGGFCHRFSMDKVCEVGTMYGGSAIGMGIGFTEVHTYDINHSNIVSKELFDLLNIRTYLLKDNQDFLNIPYNDYPMIFFDVGDHTGVEEKQFHEKLLAIKYTGVVFYDDINWDGMKTFWNSITQEKLSIDWHSSGFGIVLYNNPRLNTKIKVKVEEKVIDESEQGTSTTDSDLSE